MSSTIPIVHIGWRELWRYVSQPRGYTDSLRDRYGSLVNLQSSEADFILALTPEGAREVLTADPNSFAAMWKVGFNGVTGPGSLWVLDGEKHRQERVLLSPSFHARMFRNLGQDIVEVTRQHIDRWQPGAEIRVLDTTLDISLDIILRLVFGVREGPAIIEGRKVITDLRQSLHPIAVFFPKLQTRWFPLWLRYQRAKDRFGAFVTRRLAEHRTQGQEVDGDSLLARMLASRDENGRGLSDDDIRDELITLLLAGHETTATALSWALYELGRHPAVLRRLRQELSELGPDPDPKLVFGLPYLGAVCNETLRLRTILPEIARVLAAPMKLFGVDLDTKKSKEVRIAVSIIAIHHDAEVYPEPDQFRPERFLENSYTPFEFLPFGGGHRRCLGAGLSDFEMRIALATIVMRRNLEPLGEEEEIRRDIGMGPKHSVRMRVTGRHHASVKHGYPSFTPKQVEDTKLS